MALIHPSFKSIVFTSLTVAHGGVGHAMPMRFWTPRVKIVSAIMKDKLPPGIKSMSKGNPFMFALKVDDAGQFSYAAKIKPFLHSADRTFTIQAGNHKYRCIADRQSIVSEAGGKPVTVVPVRLEAPSLVAPGTYRVSANNGNHPFQWVVDMPIKLTVSGKNGTSVARVGVIHKPVLKVLRPIMASAL